MSLATAAEWPLHHLTADSFQLGSTYVADLDGDGDLDLQNGTGWFENVNGHLAIEAPLPGAVRRSPEVVADLDGDHVGDLVTWDDDRDAPMWRSAPALRVEPLRPLPAGALSNASWVPTDIDRDGDLDLLVDGNGSLALYTNDGRGTFTMTALPWAKDRYLTEDGDVDGDGDRDVFDTDLHDHLRVGIVEGGKVTFSDVGLGLGSPTLLDMDGDGDADLVCEQAGGPLVWLERRDGAFQPARDLHEPPKGSWTLVDLDGDGDGDLVDPLGTPTWEENVRGSFVSRALPLERGDWRFFDVNGDRRPEAFWSFWTVEDPFHPTLRVLASLETEGFRGDLGDLEGPHRAERLLATLAAQWTGAQRWSEAVPDWWFVDLDGDHVLEALGEDNHFRRLAVTAIPISTDVGDTFTTRGALPELPGELVAALTAPLDADAWPELLVRTSGRSGPDTVSVLKQTARFTYTPPVAVGSMPIGGGGLTTGDWDGDGDTDLLAADGTSLQVWSNDGKGGFTKPRALASVAVDGRATVGVVDLDGKGVRTALVAGQETGPVRAVSSTGAMTTLPALGAATWGDVDGDGDVDLVGLRDSVVVLLRRSAGGFGPPETVNPQLGGPTRPFDVDGDGDLDLLGVRDSIDARPFWLENPGKPSPQ